MKKILLYSNIFHGEQADQTLLGNFLRKFPPRAASAHTTTACIDMRIRYHEAITKI